MSDGFTHWHVRYGDKLNLLHIVDGAMSGCRIQYPDGGHWEFFHKGLYYTRNDVPTRRREIPLWTQQALDLQR